MKILHLISAGYEGGGAETLLVKLVKIQRDIKKNDVKIFSSDAEPDRKHFSDFEFKHIDGGIFKKMFLYTFNPYSYIKLKNILNRFNPDVVHLHTMSGFSPSVLFLLKKYPTVMTIHGPEEFIPSLLTWIIPSNGYKIRANGSRKLNIKGIIQYLYNRTIQSFVYKICLKNVDVFIAPSKYMNNLILNDVSPIAVINNGISLFSNSKISSNNHTLLFVGRINQPKGVIFAIKSLEEIAKQFPKIKLVIVGDGESKAELVSYAKTNNLEKHIIFAGWVDHSQIKKYYESSAIVLIPSVCDEAFGLIGPEAMSTGRPVIASRVGGIPEWLDDGKTGYLVDPGNTKQIAEKVIKLLSNRKLLDQMGRNARKKAEQFSIEKHTEKIEQIYKEVIDKYKTKAALKQKLGIFPKQLLVR